MLVAWCQRISQSSLFHAIVTGVVVAAGVLVGVETYPAVVSEHHHLLDTLDRLVLTIFCAEIVINMVAQGNKPWNYFRDPWNIFDFTVVVAAFMPFASQYVTVLRLLRVMRVLKLVHAVPKLQILVGALFKSLPSMTYVSAFLFLLFYVYAVTGTFMFGANDPVHFSSLGLAFITLFRVVTLEGWTEMLYTAMNGCDKFGYEGHPELCTHPEAAPVVAVVFFVSFILLGTMIIMNLFVGVIMNGMNEAQEEAEKARTVSANPSLVSEMHEMGAKLEEMQKLLLQMHQRVGREQRGGTPLNGGTRVEDAPPTSMS